MHPVLFKLGPIVFYNFSIFLIISWFIFSFIFWKKCREKAIDEDKIYDLMFYSTVNAFLFSRLFYVLKYPDIFLSDLLRVGAIWVVPGLSFYGALFGIFITMYLISRKNKLRIGLIFDIFWESFLIPAIIANLGILLDGSVVGKITNFPLWVIYAGHQGQRHPVQLYTIFLLIIIFFINVMVKKKYKNLAVSFSGLLIMIIFTFGQFVVEFFRQENIYFYNITVSQWILLGLFCEAMGGLYVKNNLNIKINLMFNKILIKNKIFYEKIKSRFITKNK